MNFNLSIKTLTFKAILLEKHYKSLKILRGLVSNLITHFDTTYQLEIYDLGVVINILTLTGH